MIEFSLEPANVQHIDGITRLFRLTIEETCRRNQIAESIREQEIREKTESAKRIIQSKASEAYLVCACQGTRVIAVGGYFPCDGEYEIASLYVDPSFQGAGIGKSIFQHLRDQLKQKGLEKAFLGSGYETSQAYWRANLGEPQGVSKSPFGDRYKYMIWEFEP